MGKRADLVGQRFGRILIDKFSHADKHGRAYWSGLCSCGNRTKPIAAQHLKSGNTISCGCYKQEFERKRGQTQTKNLTGQVFGYLTALRPTRKRSSNGNVYWECICFCGKKYEVRSNNLLSGSVTSCGCRAVSYFHENTRIILLKLGIETYQEEFHIPQKFFNFDERISTLRVDFMVWSPVGRGLVGIECNGVQHYEPCDRYGGEKGFQEQIERDVLKKKSLQALNIPLIELRYDEPNKENFLREALGIVPAVKL